MFDAQGEEGRGSKRRARIWSKRLESLVDPVTRGDPSRHLRWTSKSTRKLRLLTLALARELRVRSAEGRASRCTRRAVKVHGRIPTRPPKAPRIRIATRSSRFINERVEEHHARGAPVISVDTKKKELVGDFKNAGREWQPAEEPVPVRVHDFIDKELGKVIPYGVYDLASNAAWVSVGIDHDTRSSRSSPSLDGGGTRARKPTPKPLSCSTRPMGAVAMAIEQDSGSWNSSDSPTGPASPSASRTSRPAHQVEQDRA